MWRRGPRWAIQMAIACGCAALAACSFEIDYSRAGEPPVPIDASVGPDVVLGGGTLIEEISFANGLPDNVSPLAPEAHSVAVVAAPWDATRRALRLEIRPGEDGEGAGAPRAAVSFGSIAIGTRYRITGAFYFEPNQTFPGSNVAVALAIQDAINVPPAAFYAREGTFEVDYLLGGENRRVTPGTVPLGRRVPFEVVYEGRKNPSGSIRVVVDNQLIVDERGKTAYDNQPDGYMWLALSDFANALTAPLVIYLDDTRVYRYD